MKNWYAILALSLGLLGAGAPADAEQAKSAAPAVESADILKHTQAERAHTQPGNNAPVWRAVKEGEKHYSSLPDPEAGILIQAKQQFPGQDRATTAGESWRQYRNGPLLQYGGVLLVLALLGVAAMYVIKGPIKLKQGRTGRLIERFTSIERITHWTVAITFLLLAVSGLIMAFGKYVLLPVFGYPLFGWLAYLCKNIHNFVGPVFTVAIVLFFVIYVRDNLPSAVDAQWVRRLGGVLGKGHVSSGRFNAGEKLWFWGGLTTLGLVVSASGFVLDMIVPGIAYTRGNMQIAHVIHLIGAVLFIAGSFGHIYIGSVGMEGAYEGMRTGYVDDAWAREHHDLWYNDVESGKIPRFRTDQDAGQIGAPTKV